MKKRFKGIQDALDALMKSKDYDPLDDEREDDEEEVVDTENENVDVDSDDVVDEDIQEAAEEVEEDVEKSEGGEEPEEDPDEEPQEEEEEPVEKSEEDEEIGEEEEEEGETVELDFEELVDSVAEKVAQSFNDRIDRLEENLNRLVDVADKQNKAMEEVDDENAKAQEEVQKSIKNLELKLEQQSAMRKSVSNSRYVDKFEESKSIDDLSKSEKASILAKEIEAGNRSIKASDVTMAELGGTISDNARKVLERHLG